MRVLISPNKIRIEGGPHQEIGGTQGNQLVEISKLKEEVKRLEGELKSHDQGMETLMAERVDLVRQVMH